MYGWIVYCRTMSNLEAKLYESKQLSFKPKLKQSRVEANDLVVLEDDAAVTETGGAFVAAAYKAGLDCTT